MNTPAKKCINCDKEISAQKIVLHERYCKDNIIKCPICHEAVQKEELEEHNEDNHAKTPCKECGKLIEKSLLSTHKQKCDRQLFQCEYCQLSLPMDELHDHEYICGSKTEECCLCHEMVTKMEYELHFRYKCIGADRSKEETIDDLLLDSVIKSGIKINEGKNSLKKKNKEAILKETNKKREGKNESEEYKDNNKVKERKKNKQQATKYPKRKK